MRFVPRRSIGALALFLALGIAAASHAQTRPTLGDVESRVDVLEGQVSTLETELNEVRETTCIAADVHGDTYRPAHCDARCDCIGTKVSQVSACTVETNGGSNSYTIDADFEAQDCIGIPPSNYFCTDLTPCLTDADCTTAPYLSCETSTFNVCKDSTQCATPGDCPVATATVSGAWTIVQSGTLDSDVANCTEITFPTDTINHKDSVECIAQVEAQLGQPCTPIP